MDDILNERRNSEKKYEKLYSVFPHLLIHPTTAGDPGREEVSAVTSALLCLIGLYVHGDLLQTDGDSKETLPVNAAEMRIDT